MRAMHLMDLVRFHIMHLLISLHVHPTKPIPLYPFPLGVEKRTRRRKGKVSCAGNVGGGGGGDDRRTLSFFLS